MTKDQQFGQLRALLLAIGSALATWGFSDGNQWAPAIGIILAGWSFTWGLLHHRDPAKPGTVSWSLFRKFVNATCVAMVTYGWCNPEKADAFLKILPLLGPVLAARWSWIDNSEDESEKGPDGMNLPLIAVGFLCLFLLPSCELPLRAKLVTDYGSITRDAKGGITIEPSARPIKLPIGTIHAEK